MKIEDDQICIQKHRQNPVFIGLEHSAR